MRAAYTGHDALTFSQYTDEETGQALRAEPGGVYEVTPASGHLVPEIPAAWFVPAGDEDREPPDLWPAEPHDETAAEPGEDDSQPDAQ